MTDTKDRVKKSVEIAARIVKRLKKLCQGVHIMALGWEKMIPAVLDQADI
jgi:5,10-methylenetetrahydrofolate reductase